MDQDEHATHEPLPSDEIDRVIARDLPGWRREDRGIRKRFRRASFPAAIEFVGRVAELAEATELAEGAAQAVYHLTFEVENEPKPCCVADFVMRYYSPIQ